MVGDVNIFFNDYDNEKCGDKISGEIEVMIAEAQMRGRGLAREALRLMMTFAFERLNTRKFTAKILEDNQMSLKLFESLGFQEISRIPVFQQVNLSLDLRSSDPAALPRSILCPINTETFLL
jgi:RimJ/RimL family protein N-acetyltransferase